MAIAGVALFDPGQRDLAQAPALHLVRIVTDPPRSVLDGLDVGRRPGAAGPVLHFARDREIYGQGSDANVLFKVGSGMVRTCKLFSDGRRQVCAFLGEGDVFGFEAGRQQSLSAEAVCDCTVLVLRWRGPGARAPDADEWPRQLFEHAMAGLARAERHLMLLGQGSAVQKVTAFLVEYAEASADPQVVVLPMTRQDIADYLGLTIETVSRTLSRLERDGLIEMASARRIRISDLAALRRLGS